MWQEPNCDMPWDIYLDYLADQDFDQLREIPFGVLSSQDILFLNSHQSHDENELFLPGNFQGLGDGFEYDLDCELKRDSGDEDGSFMPDGGHGWRHHFAIQVGSVGDDMTEVLQSYFSRFMGCGS